MANAFGRKNNSVIVWEWTNDQGEWSTYEPHVSNFIEDNSSRATVICLGDIDRNLVTLAVDISRMVQLSKFGTERPIRREVYDGDSAVARGAIWQWRGENTHQQRKRFIWYPYNMEIANILEAAHSVNNLSMVDLDVSPINLPYDVDLSQMIQINKTTRFSRPVQRLITNANYKPIANSQNSHGTAQTSWQSYLGNWNSPVSFGNPVGAVPNAPQSMSVFGQSNASSSMPWPSSSTSTSFNFAPPNPFPVNQPQAMLPFGGSNLASSSWSVASAAAATSTPSSQASSFQPNKRRRALRRNLTPGFNSDITSSSGPFTSGPSTSSGLFTSGPSTSSGAFASSSNWQFSGNGQTSGFGQGSSATAFTTYRNPSSQQSSSKDTMNNSSFGPSIPPPPSASSSNNGASTSGGDGSSFYAKAYNSIVSVPAAAASVVTPAPAKPGARTISGSYQNVKRLKVAGNRTVQVGQDDLSHVQKLTARDVLAKYIKKVEKPPANEDCCICVDSLREASGYGQGNSFLVVQLNKCSHMFHMDCLSAMYDSSSKNGSIQCPKCKAIYGVKYGNCPNGMMEYVVIQEELPGYGGCSTIEIKYSFAAGIQGAVHPNPGRPYKIKGFPRFGYLPNNQEGQKVLTLLEVAWKRRLTFTIGTSVTSGEPDVVVWNEIHHKTEKTNNTGHGYPDPNYLSNVLAELAAQGVTDNTEDDQ